MTDDDNDMDCPECGTPIPPEKVGFRFIMECQDCGMAFGHRLAELHTCPNCDGDMDKIYGP